MKRRQNRTAGTFFLVGSVVTTYPDREEIRQPKGPNPNYHYVEIPEDIAKRIWSPAPRYPMYVCIESIPVVK